MPWTKINAPACVTSELSHAAVRLSVSAASKTKTGKDTPRFLNLFVRPEKLDGLTFWAPDRWVAMSIGTGDNAGRLRFTPGSSSGEDFKILRPFHKASKYPSFALRIPRPVGIDADQHASEISLYDWQSDWLEIDLPAWALEFSGIEPKKPVIEKKHVKTKVSAVKDVTQPVEVFSPSKPQARQLASREAVESWAAPRGLIGASNDKINEKRIELGLPAFKVVPLLGQA